MTVLRLLLSRLATLSVNRIHLILIALICIGVMLPVLAFGIPQGFDWPHHYQCAMSYVEAIRSGDFYPSWSLNRNFGYGGMEVRLYPPLAHYALALFYLLIGDWHIASWLAFTFFTFVGSYGIYLWTREYVPPAQAAFAACIFALLPYHLNQIYNTFFYAEFVGTSILPYTFVFVHRVCRRGRTVDVVGLAVAFAALILTHLPLTVIGSICFLVYGLALLDREKFKVQMIRLAIGTGGGLAASSFFWIKVIQERDLLAKTLNYPDFWLDFRLHFLLTPIQTFNPGTALSVYESSTFYYDLFLYYTVLMVVGCTVPVLIWAKRKSSGMRPVWLVFGLAVFLVVPFSRIVWEHFGLLQEVQFPWRWLSIITMAGPVLCAGSVDTLLNWTKTPKRPLALIGAGLILFVVTFSLSQVIRPAPYLEKATITSLMEKNSKDIGFTFWWTIWTQRAGLKINERVIAGGRDAKIEKWTATERVFRLSDGEAAKARVAVMYHPNWKAKVNGSDAVTSGDENGALLVDVPSGDANVEVDFVETPVTMACHWLSKAAWLFIFTFAFFQIRKSRQSLKSLDDDHTSRVAHLVNPFAAFRTICTSKYRVLLIALVAVLAVVPIVLFGVFNGADLIQHMQFSEALRSAFGRGDYYPSWSSDENLGYGSLDVRIYPPLTSFSLAFARIFTGSWHASIITVLLIFTLTGGVGAYLWAREFVREHYAVWAGVIFVLMPYRLFEIHNSSLYAEFIGCSLLPYCFVFLTRVVRNGSWRSVVGLGVSYGLLIFAHLPTTVLGSIALFVYALVILRPKNRPSTLLKLASSVALGLMASSVYWSKMVTEMAWVRIAKQWPNDYFDYHNHFLLTSLSLDGNQLWFYSLFLLFSILISIGPIVAAARYRGEAPSLRLRGPEVILIISALMTTPLSRPVWAVLPFLHEVQFPWRWLTIVSLAGAVVTSIGIPHMVRLLRQKSDWVNTTKLYTAFSLAALVVVIGLIWVGFQFRYIPANQFDDWASAKSSEMGLEWFWTTNTKAAAFSIKDKVTAGDRPVGIDSWRPTEREFTIEDGNETSARIATLYYPHWQAAVNGTPVVALPADDGAILVPVPAGRSTVRLWFKEPFFVIIAKYLSSFIWLALALIGFGFLLTHFPSLTATSNRQTLQLQTGLND